VAGPDGACAALLPQTDQSGTYFSMLIVPPAVEAAAARAAIELILVVDPASASTSDERAFLRETVARLVGRLTPRDRFLILDRPGGHGVPAAASPESVAAALAALARPPEAAPLADLLREALTVPAPSGDRVVCILARGEPSGAVDLLREARLHLGPARMFTVSLWDPAGLTLEGLARIGRGGVVNIPGGAGAAAVAAFIDGMSRPVMTGLTIDWGGAEVADVFPRRLPDLCAGRPVHVVGRLVRPPEEGRGIRVVGTARGPAGSGRSALDVPWRHPAMTPGAVHTLWARAKVLSMSEALGRNPAGDAALRREIVATALAHNLVSPFTSFISVDATSNVQRQANRDPAPR
jgi:Ca-activated chloride channel family protein